MYRTHPIVHKAVGPLHAAIPDGLVGIHGILYDPGELDHPGGRVWIDLVCGTDCTELFEMSHLDVGRARRLLARLPVRGAYSVARCTNWTQYEQLREAARRHLPTRAARRERSPMPYRLWTLAAIAAHGLLLCVTRTHTAQWVAACVLVATCNTVLGGFGHNYLHQLDPRALWLDWNGLSSLEWLLEHVASHHPYPNTPYDHDARSMEPLVYWNEARWCNLVAYPIFCIGEIVVAVHGYIGHRCRWVARPPHAPAWLAGAPWVFVGRVALHLALLGLCHGALTLLVTLVLAGGYFSYLAHLNHAASGPPTECVALQQLRNTADLDRCHPSLALFLDRQTLHHLFPTVDHSRLDAGLRRAVGAAACTEARGRLSSRRNLSAVLWRRLVG